MLKQISRALLYTVPLVLVLVLPSTFFPFIGAKYFAFRGLVSLAAIAAILGWAFESNPLSLRERFGPVFRSPVGIGFVLLTAALLLATAFAYDPMTAFWSNFERAEGSFQFLHYLLFFVLAAGLLTERKHWKMMMTMSLIAAGGVALYGVCAAIDPTAFVGPYGAIEGNAWARLISGERFQGSLGNAAYVTTYFAFIAVYIAWLWAGAKTRLRSALLAIPALAIAGFFFAISGTRGTFLGLLAGLGVGALYYAWRERRARRWVLSALLVGAIAFSGLLVMRNNPVVAGLPGARLLQLDFGQVTAQTRFWTWNSAWKGFLDRPVFGYGPENFTVAFDRHFDSRHFIPGQQSETWFDRAHNIVLDYLATTGAVGLLAWLAFIVLLFVQIRRVIRADVLRPVQETLLVAAPVMYIVQSMFLFDVLPIFMNVALLAALSVAALNWDHHKHAPDHE